MPTYRLKNEKTGEESEVFCSWNDLQEMLSKNPDLRTIIGAPMIAHETGSRLKVDDGYREVVSKIKDKYKINAIKDH